MMGCLSFRIKKKEFSVEEIYTNKNYRPPPTNRYAARRLVLMGGMGVTIKACRSMSGFRIKVS